MCRDTFPTGLLLVPKVVLTLCNLCWWCFFPVINWYTYRTYTHGGHHLQLVLVVFFCHQLVQILHLHLWWSSCLQLALVFFYANWPIYTIIYLLIGAGSTHIHTHLEAFFDISESNCTFHSLIQYRDAD